MNNEPIQPQKAAIAFDEGMFKTLTDAYTDGRLTFARSIKKWPETDTFPQKGYVFWLIHYFHIQGDKMTILYNGPYEMLIEFEKKLLKKDQLYLYLIFQLTLQLQTPPKNQTLI